MEQRILVIGATGMLGEPVARRLQADGYCVRVFSRSPEKARARFGKEFEFAGGDVEDPQSIATALRGCQGMHLNLHLAFDADLERRGAANAAQAAKACGIEHISYLSGASVCEENTWFPDTRARFEAEAAIRASGVPYSIFRSHYFMETLNNMIRGKLALQIGPHPRPYDWVAAEDYARMVARSYALPEAANKTFLICGPQALTMREALSIFRRIAHPETRPFYLPLWAAWILAKLGKRRELESALPFFRYCEQVKILVSGSPAEANALLGAPKITVEEWSKQQAERQVVRNKAAQREQPR